MFHNLDNQIQQTDRQSVSLTQQLLGVLSEEEYFARQEAERGRARVLHLMKCPKCGMQLEKIAFGDVRVDKCFSCDGVWLDKEELDLIRERERIHGENVECVWPVTHRTG